MAFKVHVPKKATLVRFVLNPWGRAFLLVTAISFILIMGVGVFFWEKYSREIDTKLRTGAFANTSTVFAAPRLISVGDEASPTDIVSILHRCGYTESPSTAMGYYTLRADAIDINPGSESYFRRDGAVIKFRKDKVKEIISLRDNASVAQYMLEPELITNLFDKSHQKRRLVHYDEIPQVMVNAVLAAEDKRFFSHSGLDPLGIVRALFRDATTKRKEGGSTLTQQLAGTMLLDRSERSISRKLREAIIAFELERKLSKKQIFEYYANSIYLGQRGSFSIHGFGEGAQVYFGKDLKQITLAEAALLAGIIQSPNMRNPFRYPDRAKARRTTVLGMMHDDALINDIEYDRAANSPLKLAGEEAESTDAPYFVDLVNDFLTSEFQDRDFQTTSYKVYTSLDMDLQRDATAAIRAGLAEVDPLLKKKFKGYGVTTPEAQVALICIDPHTAEIKALVGGRNYAASQLNRTLARRPPGSVFKPFVYTAAMNTGLTQGAEVLTPASMVVDEPTVFYYGNKTYEPSNFHDAFYGTVTLRQALSKSLNIPTIKVAEKVGYGNVLSIARKAGMTIDAGPTPAIALGSSGVTPIEIAGAYTIFSNKGTYVKPNFLLHIRDQNGTPIYEGKSERRQVIDPRVAYMMTDLLEEVMRSGTAAGVHGRGFNLPAAGKTGSSHDAWFAGFTSKLLCVVWVGFDNYDDISLEGARAALPIWTEFMKRAHQHREYRNTVGFSAPEGIVTAEVDPESGELATSACPKMHSEVFISGTQPVEICHLHGNGSTQVASWDTPTTPPVVDGGQPANGAARTVHTIPITPEQQNGQPVDPRRRKGILDRIRGIFK